MDMGHDLALKYLKLELSNTWLGLAKMTCETVL